MDSGIETELRALADMYRDAIQRESADSTRRRSYMSAAACVALTSREHQRLPALSPPQLKAMQEAQVACARAARALGPRINLHLLAHPSVCGSSNIAQEPPCVLFSPTLTPAIGVGRFLALDLPENEISSLQDRARSLREYMTLSLASCQAFAADPDILRAVCKLEQSQCVPSEVAPARPAKLPRARAPSWFTGQDLVSQVPESNPGHAVVVKEPVPSWLLELSVARLRDIWKKLLGEVRSAKGGLTGHLVFKHFKPPWLSGSIEASIFSEKLERVELPHENGNTMVLPSVTAITKNKHPRDAKRSLVALVWAFVQNELSFEIALRRVCPEQWPLRQRTGVILSERTAKRSRTTSNALSESDLRLRTCTQGLEENAANSSRSNGTEVPSTREQADSFTNAAALGAQGRAITAINAYLAVQPHTETDSTFSVGPPASTDPDEGKPCPVHGCCLSNLPANDRCKVCSKFLHHLCSARKVGPLVGHETVRTCSLECYRKGESDPNIDNCILRY